MNLTFLRLFRLILKAAGVSATAALTLLAAAADAPPSPVADPLICLQEFEVAAPRGSALTAPPTDSRLDVRQPQSLLSLQCISNHVAPTADYATIANLVPSVANVETNSPGLSEAKQPTIRGIDDGG